MTLFIGYGMQQGQGQTLYKGIALALLHPYAYPAAVAAHSAGAPLPPHPRGLPGRVFRFGAPWPSSALPPAECAPRACRV